MPIFGLGWAIQSKVTCENLVWIGWNQRYVKFQGVRNPLHMWAAMSTFVHGRAISVKCLVWKFGSDWLSLSRVIVVTDKKKKKKNFCGAEKPLLEGGYIWPLMPIFELRWTRLFQSSHVWKFGLDWLKSEVCKISGDGRSPLLGGLHVTCDAHFHTWSSYFS